MLLALHAAQVLVNFVAAEISTTKRINYFSHHMPMLFMIPYAGKIWLGKILVSHTGKSHWKGKKLVKSVHMPNTFLVCI